MASTAPILTTSEASLLTVASSAALGDTSAQTHQFYCEHQGFDKEYVRHINELGCHGALVLARDAR
jgi:hypothetical protein